jgi:hypothetical protein
MESKESVISKLNEDFTRKETEFRLALKEHQETATKEKNEAADQALAKQKELQAHINLVSCSFHAPLASCINHGLNCNMLMHCVLVK